jgi:hypothetical protein
MDYSLFAAFVSEFNSFKFNYLLVRWQKMALLVLRRVGLCVGQNQMCHLCGWLKLFLKNVRWEKIKIQKRWLLGRGEFKGLAQQRLKNRYTNIVKKWIVKKGYFQ